MKWDTLFKIGFFVLLLFFIGQIFKSRNSTEQLITTVESLRDSLHLITTTPNVISNEKEIIKAIKTDSLYRERIEKLLAALRSENKNYQNIILFQANTIAKLADSDTNIIINNYVYSDTVVIEPELPIYQRDIKDQFGEWIQGSVTMGLDTFNLDLAVKNEFNVTTGWINFKEYIDIQSLNPYTESVTQRTFVKPVSKLGFGVGAGFIYDPFKNQGGVGFSAGLIYKIR